MEDDTWPKDGHANWRYATVGSEVWGLELITELHH